MFSNILNPWIKNRNQVKNRAGIWVDEKKPVERLYTEQTVNANLNNGAYILFSTKNKVILDSFQLTIEGTSSFIRPRLHAGREFDQNGAYLNNVFVTTNSTANYYDATPSYVYHRGNPFLECNIFNLDTMRFKLMNKVPIVLPEGGKLGIYASSSYDPDNHRFAVAAVWREIEVL